VPTRRPPKAKHIDDDVPRGGGRVTVHVTLTAAASSVEDIE
jgi:hypothetical protein